MATDTNKTSDSTMMNDIDKISIKDINEYKKCFVIPNYQRGYRWDKSEADALLDDILSFAAHKEEGEIYCLQPLVISYDDESDSSWNIVDGQQRLTTIYLLLKALAFQTKKNNYEPSFSIEYDTREDSATFLKQIEGKTIVDSKKNVDFYHMFRVYQHFVDRIKSIDVVKLSSVLFENVKFILYRVDKEQEIPTFSRLNIGRIPLTDSELIKALFLNRKNYKDLSDSEKDSTQLALSRDWYEIEKTLQNDEFWLFVHSRNYESPTRIDFLLSILCDKNVWKLKKRFISSIAKDDHRLYRYYEQVLNTNNNKVEAVWKTIKEYFGVLVEWYNDYRVYHYVGYLVAIKREKADAFISECISLWKCKKAKFDYNSKIELKRKERELFIDELKNEIVFMLRNDESITVDDEKNNYLDDLINDKNGIRTNFVFVEDKKVNEISNYLYQTRFEDNGYTKRCCVNVLLLHNIETIIQYNDKLIENEKYKLPYFSRFPFHLYGSDKWDVEHIRSNSGNKDDSEEDRIIILWLACTYFNFSDDDKLRDYDDKLRDYDVKLRGDIDKYISEYSYVENLERYIKTIQRWLSKFDDSEKNTDLSEKLIEKLTEELEEDLNEELKERLRKKLNEELKETLKKEIKDKLKEILTNKSNELADLFVRRESEFDKLNEKLDERYDKSLSYADRNRIWNYTLLDRSTNREYGNHVFPYKRKYIVEKEQGRKLKYCLRNDLQIVTVSDNKKEIVDMLLAYDYADDPTKEMICKYVNDTNDDYMLKKGKSTLKPDEKVIDEILEKNNARIEAQYGGKRSELVFVLDYVKRDLRKNNDNLKYRLSFGSEVAPFVLQTTKNVFTKYYSDELTTMMQWTKKDAEDYWSDMRKRLSFYFDKLNEQMNQVDNNV